MEANVKVRIGVHVIEYDKESQEMVSSGSSAINTKLNAEEVLNRARQAQNFEQMIEIFRDANVNIAFEDGRTLLVLTENGAHIFLRDEPSRKLSTEKMPEQIVEEILAINDFADGNAVRKILEAHGYEKEQIEEIVSSNRDAMSFESPADNIDSKNIADNSEIGAARLARDSQENPNRGIFSEKEQIEQLARMSPLELNKYLEQFDEETRKELRIQIQEEQARKYGQEYRNNDKSSGPDRV